VPAEDLNNCRLVVDKERARARKPLSAARLLIILRLGGANSGCCAAHHWYSELTLAALLPLMGNIPRPPIIKVVNTRPGLSCRVSELDQSQAPSNGQTDKITRSGGGKTPQTNESQLSRI
jgi:hypothetical protein